jgi:hypothetical protein
MTYKSLVLKMDMAAAQAGSRADGELRKLIQRYAEVCQDVNGRLLTSFTYLRRGFRGEAIRLSEIEPALLDAIGELRFFQSRDWWLSYARQAGVHVQELDESFAHELQEAYDEHATTATLVERLRLLNVLRSPLAERRRVLESLAALEPNSPVWREGLRQLSKS